MNDFKNIFFSVLTGSTLAVVSNLWAAPAHAQTNETMNTSETVAISEVPGMTNWDYPSESGSWPEKLGLTDDQMSQLVSLKSDHEINTAKQKAELKANMEKLVLLMTAPKLDKQAILSLNEKIDSLKATLADARVDEMLSVMNIMTPQQREQMRHDMLVRSLSWHHSMHNKSHRMSTAHHHAT